MKIYHDLRELYESEIEAAEDYIETAHECHIEHKEIAIRLLKTAEEEIRHAEERVDDMRKMWEAKRARGEHESEKCKHHFSHWCVEHPMLCLELAEIKMEFETAKKTISASTTSY